MRDFIIIPSAIFPLIIKLLQYISFWYISNIVLETQVEWNRIFNLLMVQFRFCNNLFEPYVKLFIWLQDITSPSSCYLKNYVIWNKDKYCWTNLRECQRTSYKFCRRWFDEYCNFLTSNFRYKLRKTGPHPISGARCMCVGFWETPSIIHGNFACSRDTGFPFLFSIEHRAAIPHDCQHEIADGKLIFGSVICRTRLRCTIEFFKYLRRLVLWVK